MTENQISPIAKEIFLAAKDNPVIMQKSQELPESDFRELAILAVKQYALNYADADWGNQTVQNAEIISNLTEMLELHWW